MWQFFRIGKCSLALVGNIDEMSVFFDMVCKQFLEKKALNLFIKERLVTRNSMQQLL